MIEPVRLDDEAGVLVILDQTLLPNETVSLRLGTQGEIWEAIYQLRVRGAPLIGITAAYGAYLGVRASAAKTHRELMADFARVKKYLASARPTAVNLFWALDRMEKRLAGLSGATPSEAKAALRAEADAILAEDAEICRSIGEHSLSLLKKRWGLLTHCNAGALATARWGTATAPIYLGAERGYGFTVYADETRPLLQGARLTAWELSQAGIDVTVICDDMASIVMKEGKVQAVLVGCDRVAANGDAANKIGTSGVAILARHYGIPFYVHAPLSSVDLKCSTGAEIPIEQRPAQEVSEKWYARRMVPADVKVYNPAFDVTDNELITAIVTERGIACPPFTDSLAKLAAGPLPMRQSGRS
ncbi:MAG TPA: S-methyl-5-thioribose-1-phosphate isomerase [Spirochaetia bacterium]|nr:S-methyl-5-thioribose-1-phosphate isomerase [Spirochaetia bacterium]